MSDSLSPDITLYWNVSLAEELLRFLTGRLNCPEAAADLTHETFIRLHQFAQTNPPDNARALAYRIAINLATDYQRKLKVRSRYNAEMGAELTADSYPSEIPGPEQIILSQERLAVLQEALDELSVECRTAFLLHNIEGLTHQEIATQLGLSRVKVYRLLVKALSHLALRVNDGD